MKDKLVIFLGGLVLGLLVGFYFTSYNDVFPSGDNIVVEKNDEVDTTFTLHTRSADAIIMAFDVTVKQGDVDEVKVALYDASIKNNTLYFYEALRDGTINDAVFLPNGKITAIAFEQVFMDLVKKQAEDALIGAELEADSIQKKVVNNATPISPKLPK